MESFWNLEKYDSDEDSYHDFDLRNILRHIQLMILMRTNFNFIILNSLASERTRKKRKKKLSTLPQMLE
jgi:hypothetical protein